MRKKRGLKNFAFLCFAVKEKKLLTLFDNNIFHLVAEKYFSRQLRLAKKSHASKCYKYIMLLLHCMDYNCLGAINSNLAFIFDLNYFLWK